MKNSDDFFVIDVFYRDGPIASCCVCVCVCVCVVGGGGGGGGVRVRSI